ncbi:MAG: hypothetical protein ACP5GJ_04375 [Nanopusillaceae archaeon]
MALEITKEIIDALNEEVETVGDKMRNIEIATIKIVDNKVLEVQLSNKQYPFRVALTDETELLISNKELINIWVKYMKEMFREYEVSYYNYSDEDGDNLYVRFTVYKKFNDKLMNMITWDFQIRNKKSISIPSDLLKRFVYEKFNIIFVY